MKKVWSVLGLVALVGLTRIPDFWDLYVKRQEDLTAAEEYHQDLIAESNFQIRRIATLEEEDTDFFVVDHNPELLLAVEKVWLFINHKTHKKWPSSDEKAQLESLMKETGVFHYIENYDRDWYDDYQTEWNKSIGKPDWNPNRWFMDTDYMLGDRMRR